MATKNRVMAWYACSQYESPDGGSGYEWSLDGEFGTPEEAIAKAVETANSAMLDGDGTKIEVFVWRAESGLTESEFLDAEPRDRVAYGRFEKAEQGTIHGSDLQGK